LKYALIRTNFKANLVFIMTTTTGENVQIRQGDIITVVDTKNEETGFWQARVNEKVKHLRGTFLNNRRSAISIRVPWFHPTLGGGIFA
jgi:hypothetical protein